MAEGEWKKMERVIPVAPWTNLNMGCEKEKEKEMKMKRTNEQVTGLEQKEQAR